MFYTSDGKKPVENAACALGWTSLAIGLTEFLAPSSIQQWMGLDEKPSQRGVLRLLGVREIFHGISLLTSGQDAGKIRASLWGRVAGDVLDGALLGAAAMRTKSPSSFAAVAAMIAPVVVADMVYAVESKQQPQSLPQRMLSRVWV
jgi:hypothetical protein